MLRHPVTCAPWPCRRLSRPPWWVVTPTTTTGTLSPWGITWTTTGGDGFRDVPPAGDGPLGVARITGPPCKVWRGVVRSGDDRSSAHSGHQQFQLRLDGGHRVARAISSTKSTPSRTPPPLPPELDPPLTFRCPESRASCVALRNSSELVKTGVVSGGPAGYGGVKEQVPRVCWLAEAGVCGRIV